MSILYRYIRAAAIGIDEEAAMVASLSYAERTHLARLRASLHL